MENSADERITGPQRLDRDVHVLEGIVKGISLDGRILPSELALLQRWCQSHEAVVGRSPFNELVPRLREAITDGILDAEERQDILWLAGRFTTPNAYFSVATADMQRLHGILAGIASDGRVCEAELSGLSSWMESAEHLRGTWPYDEIDSLITSVMADGKVDEAEHRFLLNFCREFIGSTPNLVLEPQLDDDLIRFGVCASCPEIEFTGRVFCATGTSPVAKRSRLEEVIRRLGGTPSQRVTRELNYLVVCAEGNRSWAFSCYGRKVEAAVRLRKEGCRVSIIHENDLWDAAADQGVERPA